MLNKFGWCPYPAGLGPRDKGYVNYKLQEKLQKEKVNLYTPLKKNNKKIKNKDAYMKQYNNFNRISIENMFCRLDKFI